MDFLFVAVAFGGFCCFGDGAGGLVPILEQKSFPDCGPGL